MHSILIPGIVLSCHQMGDNLDSIEHMELEMKKLARFLKDESGATAIEYGLIAALIAVVIIGAVTTIGTSLNTTFTTIASSL